MEHQIGRPYYRYWAKTSDARGSDPIAHLLPYHALDVAAVGHVLLRNDPLLRARFARLRMEDEDLDALLCFLLATHDIGKFSTPAFQAKDVEVMHHLRGEEAPLTSSAHHSALGYALWTEYLWGAVCDAGCLGFDERFDIDDWHYFSFLRAVCGHHGTPPDDVCGGGTFSDEDRKAALAFVEDWPPSSPRYSRPTPPPASRPVSPPGPSTPAPTSSSSRTPPAAGRPRPRSRLRTG